MIIQCNIEREGSTFLTYAGAQYEFKHRKELTGEDRSHTCEVVASHAQDFFLGLTGFQQWERGDEPQHDHENTSALTKETFLHTKNHLSLKGLINKCEDKGLLQELLEVEATSKSPREWAGEALDKRLKELEA